MWPKNIKYLYTIQNSFKRNEVLNYGNSLGIIKCLNQFYDKFN